MKIPCVSSVIAALLASLALLLAGCASNIPIEDCKEEDWRQVGRKDGVQGITSRPPTEHAAACAKAGVVLNISSYQPGWNEGIAEFCTPDKGWREGLQSNVSKADACKGQSGEAEFSRYFLAGQKVYDANEIRRKNAAEIRRLAQLQNVSKDAAERRALREKIRLMDIEQARVRKQISQLYDLGP